MKQEKTTMIADRPIVRGTAVGGQYISPAELFTTKAGREAIRTLIDAFETNKSQSPLPESPLRDLKPTQG